MPTGMYNRKKAKPNSGFFTSVRTKGKKNVNWKGDKVKYCALHQWLWNNYGKADRCENPSCPKISKNYVWAKITEKEYERKRENFWLLCRSCHTKYDQTDKWKANIAKTRIGKKHSNATREKIRISLLGNTRRSDYVIEKVKEYYTNLSN